MNSDLVQQQAAKLQSVWVERMDGRISVAYGRYTEILAELGIGVMDAVSFIQQFILIPSMSPFFQKLLAIEASFLRRQKGTKVSDQVLSRALDDLVRKRISVDFSIYFQIGLNALVAEDSWKALRFFLLAEGVAKDEQDLLSCRINIVLAMEDLDLENQGRVLDLKKLKSRFALDGQRRQFCAFELRHAFASGDWSDVSLLGESIDCLKSLDEDVFEYLYLAQVHHMQSTFALSSLSELQDQLQDYQSVIEGFAGEYRFRTLLCYHHPDDRMLVKQEHLAYRLYLWVWVWICSPTKHQTTRVRSLIGQLSGIDASVIPNQQRQMIVNSLRWLQLFGARIETKLFVSFQPTENSRCKPLVLESLLLIALENRLIDEQGHVYADAISALGLYLSSYKGTFGLAKYLDENFTNLFGGQHILAKWVQNLESSKRALRSPCIQVNVLKSEINNIDGKVMATEGNLAATILFCEFFHKEKKEGAIEIEWVMRNCYGIDRYVPSRHDPKIWNLVTVLNNICKPFLRFSKSGDCIQARFTSRNFRLLLTGYTPHVGHLQQSSMYGTRTFLWRQENVQDDTCIMNDFNGVENHWLSRVQLETLIGASRATTLRRISEWRKNGMIASTGHGRASRYRLKKKLLEHLTRSTNKSGDLNAN